MPRMPRTPKATVTPIHPHLKPGPLDDLVTLLLAGLLETHSVYMRWEPESQQVVWRSCYAGERRARRIEKRWREDQPRFVAMLCAVPGLQQALLRHVQALPSARVLSTAEQEVLRGEPAR